MDLQKKISQIADRRRNLHVTHLSRRPFSDNYETIGLCGEFAFGVFSGIMPDLEDKPKGDDGKDFEIKLSFTVDVKTFDKAFNLICEKGKVKADIYVLAQTNPNSPAGADLIGWEWGKVLKNAPAKDFGYGVINHYIKAEKLKPMEALKKRMIPN